MKKLLIFILVAMLLLVVGCTTDETPEDETGEEDQDNIDDDEDIDDDDEDQDEDGEMVTEVQVFLIAIGDKGDMGKLIGSEDSVVPVIIKVEPTDEPLKTAFEELLAIEDRQYGESGLSNTLYQSDLTLDDVTVEDGEATVNLSGELVTGGALDNPRVKAQLMETALQFEEVEEVTIYINGENLEDVLSLQ